MANIIETIFGAPLISRIDAIWNFRIYSRNLRSPCSGREISIDRNIHNSTHYSTAAIYRYQYPHFDGWNLSISTFPIRIATRRRRSTNWPVSMYLMRNQSNMGVSESRIANSAWCANSTLRARFVRRRYFDTSPATLKMKFRGKYKPRDDPWAVGSSRPANNAGVINFAKWWGSVIRKAHRIPNNKIKCRKWSPTLNTHS